MIEFFFVLLIVCALIAAIWGKDAAQGVFGAVTLGVGGCLGLLTCITVVLVVIAVVEMNYVDIRAVAFFICIGLIVYQVLGKALKGTAGRSEEKAGAVRAKATGDQGDVQSTADVVASPNIPHSTGEIAAEPPASTFSPNDGSPGWKEFCLLPSGEWPSLRCSRCQAAANVGTLSCWFCHLQFSVPVPQWLTADYPGWAEWTDAEANETVTCVCCNVAVEPGSIGCGNCRLKFHLPVGSRVVSSTQNPGALSGPGLPSPKEVTRSLTAQEEADELFGFDHTETVAPMVYSQETTHIVAARDSARIDGAQT